MGSALQNLARLLVREEKAKKYTEALRMAQQMVDERKKVYGVPDIWDPGVKYQIKAYYGPEGAHCKFPGEAHKLAIDCWGFGSAAEMDFKILFERADIQDIYVGVHPDQSRM